jgi:hypothetical protein
MEKNSSFFLWNTHFWNAECDCSPFGEGLLGAPSTYEKAMKYWNGGWDVKFRVHSYSTVDFPGIENPVWKFLFRYNSLIELYKTGNITIVGYWDAEHEYHDCDPVIETVFESDWINRICWSLLGHISHLLADMGVPAHVKNDMHPGSVLNDDDCYEDWMDYSQKIKL